VPSQLALKTHTNFGCAGSLATLDKLADRFPLPPVASPIGDGTIIYNDPVLNVYVFLFMEDNKIELSKPGLL
jgi:hypothetical protein